MTDDEANDELRAYTLTLGDATFVHQHVVDAWAAQHAHDLAKPIATAFGLIGLYLHVERGLDGRAVQREHMRLATPRRDWPRFVSPSMAATITIHEVLATPPGPERVAMIDRWCESVWAAWSDFHAEVRTLVAT